MIMNKYLFQLIGFVCTLYWVLIFFSSQRRCPLFSTKLSSFLAWIFLRTVIFSIFCIDSFVLLTVFVVRLPLFLKEDFKNKISFFLNFIFKLSKSFSCLNQSKFLVFESTKKPGILIGKNCTTSKSALTDYKVFLYLLLTR